MNKDEETYSSHVLRTWYDIEQILSDQMNWQFLYGEELKAAQLLYNQYDGMLPVTKGGQGAAPLRQVIRVLDQLLDAVDRDGKFPTDLVELLPSPIKFEIRKTPVIANGTRTRELLIRHRNYHEKLLSEQASRTNQRAFRVALALRSIFDHYSEFPISVCYRKPGDPNFVFPKYKVTDSRNHGFPSGPYMKTLEAIFKRVQIEATLHHYAKLAKETPKNDPVLVRNRFLMRRNLTVQTEDALILSEFGWTKNSTVTDEASELYEELYSYKELKRCYRKYMKTNASMTIPTKS